MSCPEATAAALRDLGALYGPTAADLSCGLVDLGDGLAAQLARLQQDPDASLAEAIAANLGGAQRAVLRLREALLREEGVQS